MKDTGKQNIAPSLQYTFLPVSDGLLLAENKRFFLEEILSLERSA